MKIYEEFNQEEFNKWVSDKGDSTLRLDYDLNENSIVIDVGGFKGEWAKDIFDKFGCEIYIFEPVKSCYDNICKKFKENEKIHIFHFGLSDVNKDVDIFISGDASSVFGGGDGTKETIKLKSFIEFIDNNNIKKVDLIKINIEGGEYDLIEDIIKKNKTTIFKDIQVQYHRFVENCVERRNYIRKSLKKTHKETYGYEFIWENWELKE